MTVNLNDLLTEGMTAIRGLLEGRLGRPNPKAALAVAEVMHNLKPNPVLLDIVAAGLDNLREEHPTVASHWLPQTYAWHDSKKGAE